MCKKFLVRNLEGKRPLGRPRCRWEDNIKETGSKVGWINLTLYRISDGLL
jgi:hypothetical protein